MLTIAEKLTSFDLVYPNFEWWSWYRITYILFWTCGWWQGVIAFDFDGICCVRWREFDYLPMVSFGASAFKTLDRRPCFGAVDRINVSLGFHGAIARLSSWCGCWDRQCTMLRLLSSLSSRKCGALLGIVELGLRSDDGESREQRSGALLKARERSLWRPQKNPSIGFAMFMRYACT